MPSFSGLGQWNRRSDISPLLQRSEYSVPEGQSESLYAGAGSIITTGTVETSFFVSLGYEKENLYVYNALVKARQCNGGVSGDVATWKLETTYATDSVDPYGNMTLVGQSTISHHANGNATAWTCALGTAFNGVPELAIKGSGTVSWGAFIDASRMDTSSI